MTPAQQSRAFSGTERRGWALVLFGFVGFFVWAGTVPLDQGVSGSGFLTTPTEKVAVISPITGLITRLSKAPGDQIRAGELLVEFDTRALESDERATTEAIRGIETSNASLRTALQARNEQISAYKLQFQSNKQLVESGFASPNALATVQTQLSLAESESLELKSRIEQNASRLLELKEKLVSIRHDINRQKIHAPVSGQVMNAAIRSGGINVTVGTPILEIAPDTSELAVSARIPVDLGNRVATGMAVDVLFPTLPGNSTTHIPGRLEYLSAERLTDPRTQQIYLEAKVSLSQLDGALESQLRAGLPATVIVKTGPRTLLSYITRPFTERMVRGLQ